jgi:hypothetical protein
MDEVVAMMSWTRRKPAQRQKAQILRADQHQDLWSRKELTKQLVATHRVSSLKSSDVKNI